MIRPASIVDVRMRALELAVNTHIDYKLYPLPGAEDLRTKRIMDAAKSFEAFLLGEVTEEEV